MFADDLRNVKKRFSKICFQYNFLSAVSLGSLDLEFIQPMQQIHRFCQCLNVV